jgi:hypothetical protein
MSLLRGQYYTEKVVVSGQLVEHYTYELPVRVGQEPGERTKRRRNVEQDEQAARLDNARRAVNRTRRLCAANAGAHGLTTPKMLTLTHADNLTDLGVANHNFEQFVKRLNRYLRQCGDIGPKDRTHYLAVGEQQRRGSWHYHVALFNSNWLPNREYARIWGHGYTQVQAITDFTGLERYVSKYFAKKFGDEKLKGSQSYHCSNGLLQPVERHHHHDAVNDGMVDTIVGDCDEQFTITYPTDWHGQCQYTKLYAPSRTMYDYLTGRL